MSRYEAAHAFDKLGGPGDARPTAQQIIQDCNKENALQGKVILITGVTSGLGTASAVALASTGATIYAAGRSADRAKAALATIADSPNVHFLELDLASNASVRAFAADFLKHSGGKLHILMNNAGGILSERTVTEDGFEKQFAINYVGQFLLFSLLKDALLSSASPEFPSRVVNLTSLGHRYSAIRFDDLAFETGYTPYEAYGQAKTAAIYMASEIERRYGAQNLHAWSVHPGGILETQFLANSGLDQAVIDQLLTSWPKQMFKSNEQGAATQVWAAVSDDVLQENARGKFLEEVSVSKPKEETDVPDFRGYIEHTYQPESAARLWTVTEKLVGAKA
ncbi:hypothetical protein VHEMI09847 [[Torrubiella] hemipterigena]|uniref:Short-chain dehydrogenase n=1 Tax=[Torrubiella] hemipterigena TaxID=1531966 RepID=A0A0A1TS95_9HYPO|nr:hypothetical protein VHEMI09847 [[Torrubiella] hemipterigena]